jgi:hypothetical protein
MARQNTISSYLPVTFPNGNRVRRFGKHCPHCHAMVGANTCPGWPACSRTSCFWQPGQLPGLPSPLSHCLRHYRRQTGTPGDAALVGVPLWLQMATRNTPQLPSRENWSVEEEEAGPAPVGFIVNDVASVTCSDEILGRFHDQTISAWVEYEGVAFCSSVRRRPGSLP